MCCLPEEVYTACYAKMNDATVVLILILPAGLTGLAYSFTVWWCTSNDAIMPPVPGKKCLQCGWH